MFTATREVMMTENSNIVYVFETLELEYLELVAANDGYAFQPDADDDEETPLLSVVFTRDA